MSHDTDQLNRQLQQHSDELMKLSSEYVGLANDAVRKRNAYDTGKAKALLIIRTDDIMKGWTVPVQAAKVTEMVENAMIDARTAEAMLDACKTRLRAVEASLSAVQTMAKLSTTERIADNYRT